MKLNWLLIRLQNSAIIKLGRDIFTLYTTNTSFC